MEQQEIYHDQITTESKAKDTKGKLIYTHVSPYIIEAIARVREFGNKKYKDPNNWRLVEKFHYTNALIRHLIAYWKGERLDESGMPHTWHMACDLSFMIEMEWEEDWRLMKEREAEK